MFFHYKIKHFPKPDLQGNLKQCSRCSQDTFLLRAHCLGCGPRIAIYLPLMVLATFRRADRKMLIFHLTSDKNISPGRRSIQVRHGAFGKVARSSVKSLAMKNGKVALSSVESPTNLRRQPFELPERPNKARGVDDRPQRV